MTTAWYRLHGLLRVVERDRPLRTLTPRIAGDLLERRRPEVVADTQIGEIAAARGFAAWCASQGWLPRDPFAELEAAGARARGKLQLRIPNGPKGTGGRRAGRGWRRGPSPACAPCGGSTRLEQRVVGQDLRIVQDDVAAGITAHRDRPAVEPAKFVEDVRVPDERSQVDHGAADILVIRW